MIYFDNAATTQISPTVVEVMKKAAVEQFANPSAIYELALQNRVKIEAARETIAKTLGVTAKEIYFTSGGSESDNWALRGIMSRRGKERNQVITSKIEHKAVLESCKHLEKCGYEVIYLDPDDKGNVSPKELQKCITDRTALVSIMYANNEIGTIMNIRELAHVAHEHGALFHTDAVQVYGHHRILCEDLGIDLLSASGHKFHGPKGVGFLYIRSGIDIEPLIYGGSQENGIRAGTENVIGIMGMAKAAQEAHETMEETEKRLIMLRDKLVSDLLNRVEDCYLVGEQYRRNSNNICLCIRGIDAMHLVDYLGNSGICISTGSACNMKSIFASHVLRAIKMSEEDARSTIRISLSKYSTEAEAEEFVDELVKAVKLMKEIY